MAEIFTTSGEDSDNTVVPRPVLQNLFIPGIDNPLAIDGFGIVTPWGGGSTTRKYSDYGISSDISNQSTQLNDLSSSFISAGVGNISYDLEGLVGPQGIPGKDGTTLIIHEYVGLNSSYITELPHNIDLLSSLGTAADKLLYTSAYTAYDSFVWANTTIAAVKSWNDSDINTDASFFIIAADAGIYISTDDGDSWGKDNPDDDTYIQTSCAGASGEAVVLGNTYKTEGKILITENYGVTWAEKTVTV